MRFAYTLDELAHLEEAQEAPSSLSYLAQIASLHYGADLYLLMLSVTQTGGGALLYHLHIIPDAPASDNHLSSGPQNAKRARK
ncbi:uncharacterized protein PHALS_14516 [Plasmopara halstedii]|uniref:Uncharacterized protein n=1 Tax=Plasmopara halstedii TaxID=4781 RepID=A0A0P1AJ86_PLAHL|nr:uncharacterized protein PHALS_14516 [Plasmopara halstedii]CEG41246.1 hypothetical protein PHALS_14516 [Plasmopara halstedii]|eukprot:XP_024577615.1 hypothetical protein PHALS_14516 [Plasmopara halstedii]